MLTKGMVLAIAKAMGKHKQIVVNLNYAEWVSLRSKLLTNGYSDFTRWFSKDESICIHRYSKGNDIRKHKNEDYPTVFITSNKNMSTHEEDAIRSHIASTQGAIIYVS